MDGRRPERRRDARHRDDDGAELPARAHGCTAGRAERKRCALQRDAVDILRARRVGLRRARRRRGRWQRGGLGAHADEPGVLLSAALHAGAVDAVAAGLAVAAAGRAEDRAAGGEPAADVVRGAVRAAAHAAGARAESVA